MQVVPGSRLEVFDSEQPDAKSAQTKTRFMERRACPEPVEWVPSPAATVPQSLPVCRMGTLEVPCIKTMWRQSGETLPPSHCIRLLCDLFRVINHQRIHWSYLRVQCQPQLFRHGCQQIGGLVFNSSPLQREIIVALESGLIHHHTA
jgi:hypothetical protein